MVEGKEIEQRDAAVGSKVKRSKWCEIIHPTQDCAKAGFSSRGLYELIPHVAKVAVKMQPCIETICMKLFVQALFNSLCRGVNICSYKYHNKLICCHVKSELYIITLIYFCSTSNNTIANTKVMKWKYFFRPHVFSVSVSEHTNTHLLSNSGQTMDNGDLFRPGKTNCVQVWDHVGGTQQLQETTTTTREECRDKIRFNLGSRKCKRKTHTNA